MTTLARVVGDTNDTAIVELGGVDTLAGATAVEAHVWRSTSPVSTSDLVATVASAIDCTVLVRFGSWLTTAAPGPWRLEVEVTGTWSDGQTGPRTFPSAGGMPLTIRAAGG